MGLDPKSGLLILIYQFLFYFFLLGKVGHSFLRGFLYIYIYIYIYEGRSKEGGDK